MGGADGPQHAHQFFRSEEHTSKLQSLTNLVCRLLLEKKKKYTNTRKTPMQNTTQKTPKANKGHSGREGTDAKKATLTDRPRMLRCKRSVGPTSTNERR